MFARSARRVRARLSRSAQGGVDERLWKVELDAKAREAARNVAQAKKWALLRGGAALAVGAAAAAVPPTAFLWFYFGQPYLDSKEPFDFAQFGPRLEVVPRTCLDEMAMPAFASEEKALLSAPREERIKAVVKAAKERSDDRKEGALAARRAVLVPQSLGVADKFESFPWTHRDPHSYCTKESSVQGLRQLHAGEGSEIADGDIVYLHFHDPQRPTFSFREKVRLGRDPLTPALAQAVIGARSDTEFSFDYDGGGNDGAKGARIVRVQSHKDLLKESAAEFDHELQAAKIAAAARKRVF